MAEHIPEEKHGRKLVWHDEFDGATIDFSKWNFNMCMRDPATTYENTTEHARIEDGKLHLQVCRKGDGFSNCESLTTSKTMLFRYGYVEMYARLPYRHGAWPSFWMKGDTDYVTKRENGNNWFPEVDIFEVFSSKNALASNLHKWGPAGHFMIQGEEGDRHRNYIFPNAENLNNEYHIYAMEWNENAMHFFVDDHCYYSGNIGETSKFRSPEYPDVDGFHDPMFLILNNEIFTKGASWYPEGAAIDDTDVLPFDYYVDWVRLYQDPTKESLYLLK